MSHNPTPPTKEACHLTLKLGPGSPEHFHHFLLGFFSPLIYELSTTWAHGPFDRIIVRSCGPLDQLLREFGDNRIEIIDKDWHREMGLAAAEKFAKGAETRESKLRFVTIYGCDYPAMYNKRKFLKVQQVLLSMKATNLEKRAVAQQWLSNGPRILLIQRGPSLPFYLSETAERKSSGQDRRSIANHDELYQALRVQYPGCLNVMTEALTLARQIALFSLADIIIAQHGAALANIIWARPSATVIEIFPDTVRPDQQEHDLFFYLSLCMGLGYRRIRQNHDHSPVDVDNIRNAIEAVTASPNSRLMTIVRSTAFRIARPAIPINRLVRRARRNAGRKLKRVKAKLGVR